MYIQYSGFFILSRHAKWLCNKTMYVVNFDLELYHSDIDVCRIITFSNVFLVMFRLSYLP